MSKKKKVDGPHGGGGVVQLHPAATQFSTSCAMTGEMLVRKWVERGHKMASGENMDEVSRLNADMLRGIGEADAALLVVLKPTAQEQEGKPVYILNHHYFGPLGSQLADDMVAALRQVYGQLSQMALAMSTPVAPPKTPAKKRKATKKKAAKKKKK